MTYHEDRARLSRGQDAAIHDIRNPNQVVVWIHNFDQRRAQALENTKQGRLNIERERRCQAPPQMLAEDSAKVVLEENVRLRAEVA